MMLSCCGLDCEGCEAFIATEKNDQGLRAQVAAKWSELYKHAFKPEDINCTGCRSEGVRFMHCAMCQVRSCVYERERENCAGCDEYPCEPLSEIFAFAPDAKQRLDAITC